MKSNAKLRKESKPGKQSGVAVSAGPCRAGEARPQKHTKTKQQCLIMLQMTFSLFPLALRLRPRRRCAVQRGVYFVFGFTNVVCPFRTSEQRAQKQTIPTQNVDKVRVLFANEGSGFSVQPCRRKTVRLLSFPLGPQAATSIHRKLCCPDALIT
jgi:hypothetical protein